MVKVIHVVSPQVFVKANVCVLVCVMSVQLIYGTPSSFAQEIWTQVKMMFIVAFGYVHPLVTNVHDCVIPVKDITLGTQNENNFTLPFVTNEQTSREFKLHHVCRVFADRLFPSTDVKILRCCPDAHTPRG
jgi:hypothetical protein